MRETQPGGTTVRRAEASCFPVPRGVPLLTDPASTFYTQQIDMTSFGYLESMWTWNTAWCRWAQMKKEPRYTMETQRECRKKKRNHRKFSLGFFPETRLVVLAGSWFHLVTYTMLSTSHVMVWLSLRPYISRDRGPAFHQMFPLRAIQTHGLSKYKNILTLQQTAMMSLLWEELGGRRRATRQLLFTLGLRS